jgi:hypothetical protein
MEAKISYTLIVIIFGSVQSQLKKNQLISGLIRLLLEKTLKGIK